MMQTITFTCETITPMFLAGADGTTPELRAPSIKGALRFWWRAMNGHLSLPDMKKIEGEIFGDTSQRSKVIIICEQKEFPIVERHKMIAHKGGPSKSFEIGEEFRITLKLVKNVIIEGNIVFNFEKLKALFEIVCYLGGLGKRSRRGNGALKINSSFEIETEINNYTPLSFNQSLLQRLNTVTLDRNNTAIFKIAVSNSNLIESNFSNTSRFVPNIISIEKTYKNGSDEHRRLLISKATHNTILDEAIGKSIPTETKNNYTTVPMNNRGRLDFSKYVGAGQPRFASPIIASISPNEEIIITKLKTIKDNNGSPRIENPVNLGIQTNLITEIKTII